MNTGVEYLFFVCLGITYGLLLYRMKSRKPRAATAMRWMYRAASIGAFILGMMLLLSVLQESVREPDLADAFRQVSFLFAVSAGVFAFSFPLTRLKD